MNYRVRKNDPLNWVVEKFQKGGDIISRGKFSGQEKKEGWKVDGYYPNIEQAYQCLLLREIEDKVSNETKEILQVIKEAKEEIINEICKINV